MVRVVLRIKNGVVKSVVSDLPDIQVVFVTEYSCTDIAYRWDAELKTRDEVTKTYESLGFETG